MVTNNSRDKGRRGSSSSHLLVLRSVSDFSNFSSLFPSSYPPCRSPRSNLSALYPRLATVRVLTRNTIIKCPGYLILRRTPMIYIICVYVTRERSSYSAIMATSWDYFLSSCFGWKRRLVYSSCLRYHLR